MNDTWQTFEHVTRQIQQALAPDATVTHNEQLVGKSGAHHQCDVVLRRPIGQLEFTCVIECKDHNEPVGSELMRAFIGKISDLRVHQGMLVAANGFTNDALKLAREHGIKTYKLIDATNVRWRHETLLPIVFISINLHQAAVRFLDLQGNLRFTPSADYPSPKRRCGSSTATRGPSATSRTYWRNCGMRRWTNAYRHPPIRYEPKRIAFSSTSVKIGRKVW